MSYEKLEEMLNVYNELKFRLYNVEYIIRKNNNKIELYPTLYSNQKKIYDNFEDAMNNFQIYNEPIKESINKFIVLN